MRRSAEHVRRPLTADEKMRVDVARAETEEDKLEILQMAARFKREADAERATLQDALQHLKAERIQQGLSLADIQQRTGLEGPQLSRLESETDMNPTIA